MNTLILLCALHAPPALVTPANPADWLASMTWLAGSWEGPMWGGTFQAWYSTPEGKKVLSTSELRAGGKVRFHEFERFDVRDGKLVLQPYPRGKPATALTATSVDQKTKKAVFENPKKDFPTRITYHRVADDRLVITLDDPHGGSEKKEVFDLKRAKAK